jgi:hypothetical protein
MSVARPQNESVFLTLLSGGAAGLGRTLRGVAVIHIHVIFRQLISPLKIVAERLHPYESRVISDRAELGFGLLNKRAQKVVN